MAPHEDFLSDDAEGETEEDDEEADEEEKRSIRSKSYVKHLPEAKSLLKEIFGDSKPNLITDKAEKRCAVCPTLKYFKGWIALSKHAETFTKKRHQQHRGYFEAMEEALRVHGSSVSGVPGEARTAKFNSEAVSKHIIVWPPIVFVEAIDMRVDLYSSVFDLLNKEVPNICMPQFVHCRSSCGLLVFKGEAVGYLEARKVSKLFFEINKRWDQSLEVNGYIATPKDMNHIDPKREFVKWTEESYYLRVQQAQKKDKEDHDNERAQLMEMERHVENLTEDELMCKERRERFERLIALKQKQIEDQRTNTIEMEKAHRERMQRLEVDLQNDIRKFQAISAANLERCRGQLQRNEKRLEEKRLKRMEEIEGLQKQFRSIKQDIKQKEAQKAVARELEVMQRKQNFMAEMAKAEASFNELARVQESDLQARQHDEEMRLMEDLKREKEELLEEWLAKQKEPVQEERMAKQKEPVQEEQVAKQKEPMQEEISECCLCMDTLNKKNRALLKPCGHARICLGCALSIYKLGSSLCPALCPLCREPISTKPKLLPKFFT